MRIPGNTRANVKSAWLFTVLWNAVSAPATYFIVPELPRKPIGAIGLLFPVAGAGLLAWALVTTARARRFGSTWVDGASPLHPGTVWEGTVHARLPEPEPSGGYTVVLKLTCLQRTITHGSDDRTVHERILWRDEAEVESTAIRFGSDDASVPVRFAVPSDARETSAVGKGEGVLWVLTAEARLPGANLKEDFDLEVRATPGARPAAATGPGLEALPVTLDDLARAGIRVEPSPGGIAYTFGASRNRAFAAGLTAFTAIWTGALWLQWYLGFPWLFPIITGLFDVLLFVLVVDLWIGSTTTTVSAGTVLRQHRVLGIRTTRTVAATDIAGLDLNINMQTEGRYGTPYYEVRATLKNGRKVSLGSGVRSKRHAEWLAAQMRENLGLAPS